jgi:hypothetical protein
MDVDEPAKALGINACLQNSPDRIALRALVMYHESGIVMSVIAAGDEPQYEIRLLARLKRGSCA